MNASKKKELVDRNSNTLILVIILLIITLFITACGSKKTPRPPSPGGNPSPPESQPLISLQFNGDEIRQVSLGKNPSIELWRNRSSAESDRKDLHGGSHYGSWCRL